MYHSQAKNQGVTGLGLSIVILAAGQGTRMRSELPKVLQPLAGKPMLTHVLACSKALAAEQEYVWLGRAFFVYWPGGFHLTDWIPYAVIPNFTEMRFIH